MSLQALKKMALHDAEAITVASAQETDGPGGRLVLGSGESCVVQGLALPVRNRALSGGYSAGAYGGELRKFVFTDANLADADCQIEMHTVLTTEDNDQFSVIHTEHWSRMGLWVAYGKKVTR
jgi:hypothetical protein